MTGSTICGRTFEFQIDMTVATGNSDMLTGQFKDGIVMIKAARLPTIGRMTAFTLRAQTTAMRVVLAVTGSAIHGCAFEDTVNMTALASYGRMFPIKMEGEQGVIHCRKLPAFGRMTSGAVGSKLTIVMVVLRMTGETFLRGHFQVMQVARIDMTLGTGYRRMFTDQIERHLVVVKGFAV
jgi:hypothetical protein